MLNILLHKQQLKDTSSYLPIPQKNLLESKLPRGKIQVECSYCKKPTLLYRNKIIKAILNNQNLFCSRECFYKKKNKTSYDERISYFCNDCYKYTPRDLAIMYTTKNKKRTYPICPYCKRKVPLRVKTHGKRKSRDHTLKRIE